MDALLADGLLCAAKCTKHIAGHDPLAAEPAKHSLIREADRFRRLRDAVSDVSGCEILQVLHQCAAHFVSGRESALGLILD